MMLPDINVAPGHGRPGSRATTRALSRPSSRASSSSSSTSVDDIVGSQSESMNKFFMSREDTVGSQSLSRVSTASTLPPACEESQCDVACGFVPCKSVAPKKRKSKLKRSSSLPSIAQGSMTSSQPVRAKHPVCHKGPGAPEKLTKPQKAPGKGCLQVMDPQKCLLEAAFTNDASAIKVLAVMDLKGLRKHVNYALLYAITSGSYDAVRQMFWYGATIDAQDACNEMTVWECAQRSPEPENMKLFLQQMKTGPSASAPIQALFNGQSSQQKSSIVRRGAKGSIKNLKTHSTI